MPNMSNDDKDWIALLLSEAWSSSSSCEESSSDSNDEQLHFFIKSKRLVKRARIQNYVEETVPLYSPDDFFSHFRMSRELLYFLEGTISRAGILPTHSSGREKITSNKAILVTIWYLANRESFRQVADRFNLALSTSHVLISKVITHFVETANEYIRWPNNERSTISSSHFSKKQGIEGILGAVDGTHIPIKRPIQDEEVYVNRKGYHSILLQGTCDHEKLFIDVHCGEPGSLHDARMLRKSSLYRKANEDLLNNMFLLGDSAYPSLNWLVPPYKDNGNLSNEQKLFNYKHSATRMIIEHAFGLLKGRFRRLRGFENENINFINKCIVTACVLHNICIRKGEIEITLDEIDLNDHHIEQNNDDASANRREIIFNRMFNINS